MDEAIRPREIPERIHLRIDKAIRGVREALEDLGPPISAARSKLESTLAQYEEEGSNDARFAAIRRVYDTLDAFTLIEMKLSEIMRMPVLQSPPPF